MSEIQNKAETAAQDVQQKLEETKESLQNKGQEVKEQAEASIDNLKMKLLPKLNR